MNEREILDRAKEFSAANLMPLVSCGQVSMLFEDSGRIRGIMSADLVEATMDEAWDVLVDFDRYSKFLPGITFSKVVSRKDDTVKAKFAITIKIMGIGGGVKYFYEYTLKKPSIEVVNVETGRLCGYWELHPSGDENRVILLHADAAKDIKSMNVFLRFLIEKIPTAEIGLHLAPVVMLVKGLKKRMEAVHRGKG
ncbi:MAG: SRPBCC family protein [bacterium]